ncbi:hypothetical protein GE09DRAFT_1135143, partial [Coniochaeta sp. 2T2.1]
MVTTSWALLPLLFNILTATITSGSAVPIVNPTSTMFSRSSTASRSTITAAPSLPYGGQVIPINTCSVWNETESQFLWNNPWCSIQAGTVQLTFWPTDDNYTYPSTIYDAGLDYTFTSPSVYMVIDTIYGYNTCGPLGPTASNAILAFDLTDISTLVPYTLTTETHRPYTRQLHLSDLGRDCASLSSEPAVATKTWRSKSDETRCNPSLIVPVAIKRYGYPYWQHCGNVGNKFGLFDPPYAIQPVDDLFNTDPTTISVADPVPTTKANVEPSTTPKDTALPTDVPDPAFSIPIQAAVASPTISDVWTPPATVVTKLSGQIVSLGPSGIEIISVNDGQTLTSTYLPVGGATQGSQSIPSVVTYEGHTLTAGGAAVTVTAATSTVSRGTAAVSGSVGTAVSSNTTSTAPVHVVTAAAVRTIGESSSVFFGLAVVLLM